MRNTRIDMFEADQSLKVLNETLLQKNISADDVVAIQEQAPGSMAVNARNRAKYRVFYRC